ncbi:MAG: tetratricopeptide repeat protein [Chloroflexi bacterium]|nr:tetratricopeptide repeat protein [Chloroflexota bacterium]
MSDRRIFLFGVPRIEQKGLTLQLERRKALALLAYLAVNRQPQSREPLAEMLWPGYETGRATAYLRNTLWTLNKALGSDWAVIDNESIKFNDQSAVELDILRFETLLKDAPRGRVRTREDHQRAVEILTQAAALYRGDFMAGFTLPDSPAFEEWQLLQTESFRRAAIEAREYLVHCLIVLGDFETAKSHTRQLLKLDALHEPAHRQLLRLYAWTGQLSAGLRHYKELESLLERELGVAPDKETKALHEALQAQRVPPPPLLTEKTEIVRETQTAKVFTPPPSTLPPQNTPFVGRSAELQEIARLLNDPTCRLLTLIGQGGIGKTRLAVEAAGQAAYRDGCHFISLAPVCSDEFIIPTIAETLKVFSMTNDEAKVQLHNFLRSKQLLLVVDNFEHLLPSAELLAEMLAAAPELKMIVTSRERLQLREEWLYEVKGLTYPVATNGQSLEDYGAISLFVQSARRVRPDFSLSPSDREAVMRICQLVEGMPLALEIAATWLQILSCAEIANEIQRGLDILTTETRNIPERHRSLRAVFEQTWERLSAQEKQCLSRLATLRGGFRQEAAQIVAGASLPLLLTLTSKSLLRRGANGRYEIHELLRQYAEQKLSSQDRSSTYDQHCEYFSTFLAERAAPMKTHRLPEMLREIEQEIDNIRSAWYHAVAQRNIAALYRSIFTFFLFYLYTSRFQEGAELVQKAIDQLEASARTDTEKLLQGHLYAFMAAASSLMGHINRVPGFVEKSLSYLRQFPGYPDTAPSLLMLGDIKSSPGYATDDAEPLLREGLALFEQQGDRWGIATGLCSLGRLAHIQTRHEEGRRLLEQALKIYEETGQQWGIVFAMSNIGQIDYTLGDYESATRLLEERLPLLEQIGNRQLLVLSKTALVMLTSQSKQELMGALASSLQVYRELGDMRRVMWALYELGTIAMFNGYYADSERYLDECLPLFQQIGDFEGIFWTLTWQACIALFDKQDPDTAERLEFQALDAIKHVNFPWGVAGAEYVLGDIALARNQTASARQHYLEALRIAYEVQSMVQILRHLSGMMAWFGHSGNLEHAAALAVFLAQHPSSWVDTQKRARQMLGFLEKTLTQQQMAAAHQQARAFTLETLIPELLQSSR